MTMRWLFGSLAVLVMLVLIDCGKEDEGGSTSFLLTTAADLPNCTSARSGNLAYVKDEDKFYTCNGSSWVEASIKGPTGTTGSTGATGATGAAGSGGVTVYNGSGIELGSLALADWPQVGIRFSDGAIGMFYTNGKFANSLCNGGACNYSLSGDSTGVTLQTSASGSGLKPTLADRTSYALFAAMRCQDLVYYSQLQPIKNALFITSGSQFVKATGNETAVTFTSSGGLSAWAYDVDSCNGDRGTGSGVCCTVSMSGTSQGYRLPSGSAYTFPNGLTFPSSFTGPFRFSQ